MKKQLAVASLITPCLNQADYTALYLASLPCSTRIPYEIIIIDNCSTDSTPQLLGKLSNARYFQDNHIKIIHNSQNMGFAKSINQGLRVAQGQHLLLLNNDTVLTPGWLEAMIACSDHGSGLVGPVTNYAPPPQLVEPGYASLEGLYPFARERYQKYRGQAMHVDRLSGFCLLIRREVLDKIGMLDERFGLGFFEDDDLCFRARDAGFKLSVALDVYIHHFGSRTIQSLDVTADDLLTQNFGKFKEKWGEERTVGYRRVVLPGQQLGTTSETPAAEPISPVRVSLSMIVKNEEFNLGPCLDSIRDIVDELVIVDTGSTDRTKEIAQSYGAKLADYPWIDHFAAARNVSLEQTTGDYVFWLDADDRVDEANQDKLRKLFSQLSRSKKLGYVMQCLCLPDPVTKAVTQVDHVRLFPKHAAIKWRYRVHEQILPALREQGGEVAWTQIQIQHTGYQDVSLRKRKLERDLRLLHLENEEHPNDPFTLFNLGSVSLEQNQPQAALEYLLGSLQRSQITDSITRKLYSLIVNAERLLGRDGQALATCIEGITHFPYDAELLYQEAVLRLQQHEYQGAAQSLETILKHQEVAHFASLDPRLRSSKARSLLGTVYLELNRPHEAMSLWKQALEEDPNSVPTLAAWGDYAVRTKQWSEVESLAERLEAFASPEGKILQVRMLMTQGQFHEVHQLIQASLASFPQHLGLHTARSHALLKEGKNWAQAERALLDLLALDPQNAEAQHNLKTLRSQHGTFVN